MEGWPGWAPPTARPPGGVFTGAVPAPCPCAPQVPHARLRRLWPHHRELRFAPQVSLPRPGVPGGPPSGEGVKVQVRR